MRFVGACIAAAVLFTVPACGAEGVSSNGQIVIPESGRGSTWISGQEPDESRIDVSKLELWGLSMPTDEVVNNYDAVRMIGTQCVFVIDQMDHSGSYTYSVAIVPNDETKLTPHDQEVEVGVLGVQDFIRKHEAACA